MADIVLLHGWGRGSKSFGNLKKLLEEKGHTVHLFDLPGFGVVPPPPTPWAVDDYVNFVREIIRKENLQNFYLFGHSFGGRVGIKLAAKYPAGLAGLILCDAAGITPRPKIKIAIWGFFARIGNWIFSFSILKPFREAARKLVYWVTNERDYYFLQNDIMRETFKKTIAEQLNDYLPRICVPTLVIWGKNDKMTRVADAYTIQRGIAGSELKILEGVGHTPHVEAPEKIASLIYQFIKK